MKLINHQGKVIENKLVQLLQSNSHHQITDPACRLLISYFELSPDLIFRRKVSNYIARVQTSRIDTLERMTQARGPEPKDDKKESRIADFFKKIVCFNVNEPYVRFKL